jgi:hypothetical protein
VIAQSVQRLAAGWTNRVRGFDSRWELGFFLFFTAFRPVLGPNQPPIQWVPGVLSPEVKRPGRETDHSPPSNAEVRNAWRYTSTLNMSSWHGTCLSTGTSLPYHPITSKNMKTKFSYKSSAYLQLLCTAATTFTHKANQLTMF